MQADMSREEIEAAVANGAALRAIAIRGAAKAVREFFRPVKAAPLVRITNRIGQCLGTPDCADENDCGGSMLRCNYRRRDPNC